MPKPTDKNAGKKPAKAEAKSAAKPAAKKENPATKHLKEALERIHAQQHQSTKDATVESHGGKDPIHGGPTTGRQFRHQGR